MLERPVRVLQIVNAMNRGGAETWLLHVLRNIDRGQVAMDFFVHERTPGAYDAEINKTGAQIFVCRGPHNLFRQWYGLWRLQRRHGPYDIVHSHLDYYGGFVVFLTWLTGVRGRVVNFHTGTHENEKPGRLFRRLYIRLMKFCIRQLATGGLGVSSAAAACLFGDNWRSDPRWRVHTATVDLLRFCDAPQRNAVRVEFGIPINSIVFGHVGSFVEAKNHTFLIRVGEILAARDRRFKFLLIGGGSLQGQLERAIHQRGLENRFIILPPRDDIPRLMLGAMDFFLFPSLYEGLGLALVEAQAAGLRCFASTAVPRLCEEPKSLLMFGGTRLSSPSSTGRWRRKTRASSRDSYVDQPNIRILNDTPMKFLQLVEAAATGAGRHVTDLTDGLLTRGHEVHLLYSDLRFDQVFADTLRHLNGRFGFWAFRVPIQRKPSLRDISVIHTVRQHLRRHGPFDIVHCHSTKAGLVGRFGLVGHPVKRLYTSHGFFTTDPTRGRLIRCTVAALEAALSRLCHGVIVVSRQEYAHALKIGIPPAKLCLIPNGVVLDRPGLTSLERAALRRQWGLAGGEVCIGFVGRLAPVKSPETMLRSFAAVASHMRTSARLVMVGDGPLAGMLRRLALDLGLGARVIWLGARDARPLMNAFDVLALTSDSEGHPLVVLEAMAHGLPVVATSVGGISETVQPGVNGYIAPVRGVAEIAAALDVLIHDSALRERMGQASRALSLKFSSGRMVDQTVHFYDQVVSGAWTPSLPPDWTPEPLR